MKNNKKIKFYLAYTMLFGVLAAFAAYFFYSKGRTMIDLGGDGYRQHYRALVYYSDYLKRFFHNLSSGKFVIPQWDFSIGEGNDILSTFHYYCMGDIFTFFSFLSPDKYMYLYYDAATFARMYFAGISFSLLCFYKKKENDLIILSCALLYAFNPMNLANMAAHVFFLSASVFLPLIVLGVEKVINGEKPFVLILSVMLSSLSNIYFFYMNVISTIVYTIIRVLFDGNKVKEKVLVILKVGLFSFYGVLMSAVIFLPSAYSILSSTRFEGKILWAPFYGLNEYKQMFTSLSFGGYLFIGGFTVLGILSIILFVCRNRNRTLLVLTFAGILFSCFPFFGTLYNAMAYPTTRWAYALSLLMNYLIVDTLDGLDNIQNERIVLLVAAVLYYGLCAYLDMNRWQIHIMFLLIAVVLIGLLVLKNRKIFYFSCLLISVFSLAFDILYSYSPKFWNLSEHGTPIAMAEDIKGQKNSIFEEEGDTFYRFSGDELETNQSIHGHGSSTQYYWSIANDNVIEFRKEVGLSDHNNHHFDNYDDRFVLNSLAGVKYYLKKKDDIVPSGFEMKKQIDGFTVYENVYSLPLLFGYDGYLEKAKWDAYDIAKKNEALLQTAIVDSPLDGFSELLPDFHESELSYQIETAGEINVDNQTIQVQNGGSDLLILAENKAQGEYYLLIEGLFSDVSSNIVVSHGQTRKYLFYKSQYHSAYPDKHDFLINLGNLEGLNEPIAIHFPDAGEYTYKSIKVIYQPLEAMIGYVEKRNNLIINDIEFADNRVKADIVADKDQIVCISIPYSKGWKVYLDGEPTELYRCNIQYMCIPVKQGTHLISLKYSTPLLKEGTIISGLTLADFVAAWLKNKKYNKMNEV